MNKPDENKKEQNITETATKKTKKKKWCIILLCIIAVIVGGVAFLILDYKEPEEDFYFVRYIFNYETDMGTSTIYHYDAETDAVYEIGKLDGDLARSTVNKEHTYLIGIVEEHIIQYDLEKREIIKDIDLEELEVQVGKEYVQYDSRDFDFTDEADGVYLTMRNRDGNAVYLYNLKTDELQLISDKKDYAGFEYVNGDIYYVKSGDLYKYDAITQTDTMLVDIYDYSIAFSVSSDGEDIIIRNRIRKYSIAPMFIYNIDKDKLHMEGCAYCFTDACWSGDTYIYVQEYPGIFVNVNPTIKVDTRSIGPDKVIYRIEGFLKGGTLRLVENL